MDDDPKIMICALAETHENRVDGSVRVPCFRCGKFVWLSPTGQEAFDNDELILLCQVCGHKNVAESLAAGEDIEIAELTDEQVDELTEKLGLDSHEQTLEMLKQVIERIKADFTSGMSRLQILGRVAATAVRDHPLFSEDVRMIVLLHDDDEAVQTCGGYGVGDNASEEDEQAAEHRVCTDLVQFLAGAAQQSNFPIKIVAVPRSEPEQN